MSRTKTKPRGYLRKNDHAFVDADPAVYSMRAVHNESGEPSYAKLARDSGLCYATVRNLLAGKTRRPQHYTVIKLLESGYGLTATWRGPGRTTRVIKLGRR